jgi:hypothetical protein
MAEDNFPINNQHNVRYRANQSGAYRALLYNDDGCTALTEEKIVAIETHDRESIIRSSML